MVILSLLALLVLLVVLVGLSICWNRSKLKDDDLDQVALEMENRMPQPAAAAAASAPAAIISDHQEAETFHPSEAEAELQSAILFPKS